MVINHLLNGTILQVGEGLLPYKIYPLIDQIDPNPNEQWKKGTLVGWVILGDEILPRYIGMIINHEIRIPINHLKTNIFPWKMMVGFDVFPIERLSLLGDEFVSFLGCTLSWPNSPNQNQANLTKQAKCSISIQPPKKNGCNLKMMVPKKESLSKGSFSGSNVSFLGGCTGFSVYVLDPPPVQCQRQMEVESIIWALLSDLFLSTCFCDIWGGYEPRKTVI